MNALSTFTYKNYMLHTIVSDQGELLFRAKHVCRILDITNVGDALSRLDADEKLTSALPISGQQRNIWFVTESGVYRLIFTSRKPEAEAFKRWLAHEVLPQLRRTGAYSVDPSARDAFAENQLLRKITSLQENLLEERRIRIGLLEQQGVKKHRPPMVRITANEIKSMVEMHRQFPNLSYTEIGRRHNRSAASVCMLLRKYDSKVQPDLFDDNN